MSAKSIYGNANYGLIDSNKAELTGLDIPMPQSLASKLGFPPTSGYFFTTIKDEVLDTLDKIILITKKGHLKLSFKTTIFTNGGQIDIQILKLNSTGIVARRQFSTDGYVEINFEVEVEVNDQLAIYVQANVGGAVFKFIPADGYLVEQSAYILNMELIEPFDDIGSLKWSIDPNLENFGSCIKLDRERTLIKADYPLLYDKLVNTPYIRIESDVDFTLLDFTKYPYLRTGSVLNKLEQNLPDPDVVSEFSNGVTNSTGAGTAKFGGNCYMDIIDNVTNFDGVFEYSHVNEGTAWGGIAGAGPGFPTIDIKLVMSEDPSNPPGHIHPISYTITNVPTNNNYNSDPNTNIRLSSSQMFLYMICDNQL